LHSSRIGTDQVCQSSADLFLVIERFLWGIDGPGRTALVIGLWSATWGGGGIAIMAGWKFGLLWLVVLLAVVFAARAVLRPAYVPAAESAVGGTLEERVFARLETIAPTVQSADASPDDEAAASPAELDSSAH
jgi:hypothetical protein